MVKRLKKIEPLQLGKVLAVIYGLGSLIFVPFLLLFGAIASMAPQTEGAPPMTLLLGMGAGFMLLAPILYALMGFLSGFIGAFIYNIVAKWIGGIEVEVE